MTTAALTRTPLEGWKGTAYLVWFWLLAIAGLIVMTGAWILLPLASLEEVTEQGKALAAGTTMAGTTLVFGVLPLVIAHATGLLILCSIGVQGRYDRWRGFWLGVAAVLAASIIGLTATLILSGGRLIATPSYVP